MPSAPRAPAMLRVDSALSMAMSETYLTEIQSDHSIHQQLSALAEAYLQHTAGRSSEGSDSLSVGMLSPELGPELDPELPAQSPTNVPYMPEGIGQCQIRRPSPAAADEVARKLCQLPSGSPRGILAHHGRQTGSSQTGYAEESRYQEWNGGYSRGSKQRLQLRVSRRTDALGKRRLTNTERVRTPACAALTFFEILTSLLDRNVAIINRGRLL